MSVGKTVLLRSCIFLHIPELLLLCTYLCSHLQCITDTVLLITVHGLNLFCDFQSIVKAVPAFENFLPPAIGGSTECLCLMSFNSDSQLPRSKTSASFESSEPTTGVVREAFSFSWVSL